MPCRYLTIMVNCNHNSFNWSDANVAKHERFMKAALREAAKAAANGDVPVGAVIVKDGKIIGRGHNMREVRQDALLHAEIAAIRQACRRLKSWRLSDCTLYVTLEPCLMCSGAILQSRIDNIIFGALDPKAGACCSVIRAFDLPLHHTVNWQYGLLSDECSTLLKSFFRSRREQKRAVGTKSQRKQAALEAYQARCSDNDSHPQ